MNAIAGLFLATESIRSMDLQDPPAVLAQRLPWGRTEEALALKFSRKERLGFAGLTMYWPASKGIQLARRWGVGSKSEKPLH